MIGEERGVLQQDGETGKRGEKADQRQKQRRLRGNEAFAAQRYFAQALQKRKR